MDEAPSVVREQTQITSNLTKTALYGSTQTTIKFTQEYEYPSRLNVYSAPQPDRLGVSPKCTRAAPLWCPMFPHSHEDTMPSQQSARGGSRSKSSSAEFQHSSSMVTHSAAGSAAAPPWSRLASRGCQRSGRARGWVWAARSLRVARRRSWHLPAPLTRRPASCVRVRARVRVSARLRRRLRRRRRVRVRVRVQARARARARARVLSFMVMVRVRISLG